MIKIDAESLKDYQTCALLYDFRDVQKLKSKESLHIRERRAIDFEETIKKVASYFFYKKQAFSEPSYLALQNRWQKLWFNSETTALDIATLSHGIFHNSETSYTTQAAVALLEFYEDFANKPDREVLLSNEEFNVPMGKEVVLNGEFDLITRENKSGRQQYTVYKWSGIHIRPGPGYWVFDFAILDYAFRYRNDFKNLDVEYRLWDFGSAKPGPSIFKLSPHHQSTLKYWAEDLGNAKVHVPRRGLTSFCKNCPYDTPCKNWVFPSEGE